MDPNATLRQLREHLNADDFDTGDGFDGARELFIALDEWLCRGGFLPSDWEREPTEDVTLNRYRGDTTDGMRTGM